MSHYSIRIFALTVWFVGGLLTSSSLNAQQNLLLINRARILDVDSGTVGPELKSILVTGNQIAAIANDSNESDIPIIDVGGAVVMPGLIDLHSHLLLHPYDEASWNQQVLNESLELRTIRGTVAARKTVEAGFTTLRDLGTEGAGFADIALRDAIDQGLIPGPRVFAATKALVTTGGYGPSGFDPRWDMPVGAQTADGVAECRKATRQQIAAGADWIKIYADYRRRPGAPSTPTFSQEELDAIVDEANSAGIPVSAHAITDEGIRRSVQAGVKTIEHGYQATVETLELMKANNVVLCPTLMASESIARYQGWDPESDPEPDRITTAKNLMRNALDVGVTIACGSDVGVFPHGDNVSELELMYAYGMEAEDVLRSATIVAAKTLKQERLGRVQSEYFADLIVVEQNPIESLSTLRRPLVVIKDGQVVVNQLSEQNGSIARSGLTHDSNATATESGDASKAMPESPDNVETTEPSPPTPEPELEDGILEFGIDASGNYKIDNQEIAKEKLAERIANHQESGPVAVRLLVPRKLPYARLIETQNWLRDQNIRTVYLEFVTD